MARVVLPSGQARRRWLRRHLWAISVYCLLGLMLIYERIIQANAFSAFNMQSLVDGSLPLALVAMAQTCAVLTGGVDLAVGAVMTLANVVAANAMVNASFGEALGIALAIVAGGAAIGALTAMAITLSGVPDIIVTLASSAIWGGIALQVMPTPSGGVPQQYANILTGAVGSSGFPVGVIVIALALAILWLPVRRSRPGLALYALGSNRTAAFLSGVHVARTRMVAYALDGVFAALAGLVLTAQTQNGSASSGASYTLNSVAAIVIGGVALTGGRGGMLGPVGAAFILTLLAIILGFLNVDPNYAQVIQGAVVVLAVMIGGMLLRPEAAKLLLARTLSLFRAPRVQRTRRQEG